MDGDEENDNSSIGSLHFQCIKVFSGTLTILRIGNNVAGRCCAFNVVIRWPYHLFSIAGYLVSHVISKTIKRLLKIRITKHVNDQNYNDTQHGFREKRSCLTNLLDFFEVNRIYDRTKAVDLVYIDFQKAFDKVPHERLMAQVEAHGIRGNYSRWIRNWLTGRTQSVVIHDETSDSALVTSRVPQGSVLGPLLLIIYNLKYHSGYSIIDTIIIK
ncbi:Reverse transcriptase domain [Trinorchestia longiramus]|nr:Reverse transcriptase domain [Trinorchestia longiramus]